MKDQEKDPDKVVEETDDGGILVLRRAFSGLKTKKNSERTSFTLGVLSKVKSAL